MAVVLFTACGNDDDAASATTAADGAATTEAAGDAPDEVAVDIVDFLFEPKEIRVAAGGTVTWTNQDAFAHTVLDTGDSGYDSGNLDEGDTFAQTFDEPGSYPYLCGIHNYMTGTVVVE